MRYRDIIYRRNIGYYARYYRIVALSVVVAVMVIVGSLIVGDSVRSTLRNQVDERLGATESIIFANQSYLEDDILTTTPLADCGQGYLLSQGFISYRGALLPVMVWGCDDEELDYGLAKINEPLFEELGESIDEDLVLRLPAKGLIPSGSLFVTANYTTSIRLKISSVKSAAEGGNINLRNEQIQPLNVFLSRKELAEELGVEGRINLIFADRIVSQDEWHEAWQSQYSGLMIMPREGFTEISSSRVFLQDKVVETICHDNPSTIRLHSYLANHLRSEEGDIPYSFVTAMEEYAGHRLSDDEVILSDYSAQRLKVKRGDRISVSYFTAEDLKNLSTDSVSLRVVDILPLEQLFKDKGLSAEFPGLSDVDRCSEWDSDLPIDMNLISDEDEDYWYRYRHTPKAIIAYNAVKEDWSSDYGSATALRASADSAPRLENLTPEMFGLQLIHPRADALYAAGNGVDFSSLFLALGFFIVVAALLLMYTPLAEMYSSRQEEIATMQVLGYSQSRLRRQLFNEALPIVLAAAIAGIVGAVVYTEIILWLLEGVWKGATHTSSFDIALRPLTLVAGTIAGIGCALGVVWLAIKGAICDEVKQSDKPSTRLSVLRLVAVSILLSLSAIALYGYSLTGAGSVMLSVGAGCLLMVAIIAIIYTAIVCRYMKLREQRNVSHQRLTRAALYANRQQVVLSLTVLAFSVFIVFVVGLNRRSFDNIGAMQASTGGYTLWCESAVALQHDPASEEGRRELGIDKEWGSETKVLTCLRYGADDASCLNLNKVSSPTILGVDFDSMSEDSFSLGKSIYKGSAPKEIFSSLKQPLGEGVYPALVDATVLQWSLVKQLGDTLRYTREDGRQIAIVMAATLSGSLFQGNILIDKSLFKELWPEQNGCNIFLVATPDNAEQIASTKQILSQGLYEYGLRPTLTSERLKMFNEVTDTYLSIFMTLGSIGLMIGIFSLIVVIRKTLARQSDNTRLMLLLGYSPSAIKAILYKENSFAPMCAIVIGVVGAVMGIGTQWRAVSPIIWASAGVITIILLYLTRRFINIEIIKAIAKALKTIYKQNIQ